MRWRCGGIWRCEGYGDGDGNEMLLLFKMFIFVKKTFYIMFYGAALCTHYSMG